MKRREFVALLGGRHMTECSARHPRRAGRQDVKAIDWALGAEEIDGITKG